MVKDQQDGEHDRDDDQKKQYTVPLPGSARAPLLGCVVLTLPLIKSGIARGLETVTMPFLIHDSFRTYRTRPT